MKDYEREEVVDGPMGKVDGMKDRDAERGGRRERERQLGRVSKQDGEGRRQKI